MSEQHICSYCHADITPLTPDERGAHVDECADEYAEQEKEDRAIMRAIVGADAEITARILASGYPKMNPPSSEAKGIMPTAEQMMRSLRERRVVVPEVELMELVPSPEEGRRLLKQAARTVKE